MRTMQFHLIHSSLCVVLLLPLSRARRSHAAPLAPFVFDVTAMKRVLNEMQVMPPYQPTCWHDGQMAVKLKQYMVPSAAPLLLHTPAALFTPLRLSKRMIYSYMMMLAVMVCRSMQMMMTIMCIMLQIIRPRPRLRLLASLPHPAPHVPLPPSLLLIRLQIDPISSDLVPFPAAWLKGRVLPLAPPPPSPSNSSPYSLVIACRKVGSSATSAIHFLSAGGGKVQREYIPVQ
jgi:hypothetical protein